MTAARARQLVRGLPPARRVVERLTRWPPVGKVRWGRLRTVTPLGAVAPGESVEHHYLRGYLDAHRDRLAGHLVEVRGSIPVASLVSGPAPWEHLTRVGFDELEDGVVGLPAAGGADAIVIGDALSFVADPGALCAALRDLLRPGGSIIAMVPGLAPPLPLDGVAAHRTFSQMALERILTESFGNPPTEVRTFGNPLAALCMLHRLPATAITAEELWWPHQDFPVTVAAIATRDG